MEKVLRKLRFSCSKQYGCDTWSKVYNGFILFIVKSPKSNFLACITVGGVEIGLPDIKDESWVIAFDKENI